MLSPSRVAVALPNQWPGPDQADIVAEFRSDYPDASRRRAKCRAGYLSPGRLQPELALPLGHRAADDNPIRIEGIDPAHAGNREGLASPLHQESATRVALAIALRDIAAREGTVDGARRQERRTAGEHLVLRLRRQAGPGRDALEMTHATAPAARPVVGNEGDVAKFAGCSVRAEYQTAIADDGTAQAG